MIRPLTTSADSGTAFTGGAGADTFIAAMIADSGTGTTLNAGDNLVGGLGIDTLSISVSGLSTTDVASTSTTLSGVEKVLVSNFDSNADDAEDHEFNASIWTGVTTVGLSSSAATGDTKFSNVGNIVAAEMSSGAADLEIDNTDAAVTGTTDTQTLVLNGVTAGTFTADAGIETVAISAASTATKSTLAALAATGATKLTIDADVALTITAAIGGTILTIDASASAAAVSLVASAAADLTVTGGAGNDVINVGAALTTADSITGGDGTDTLVVTETADIVTGLKVSGFETLRLSEAATNADVSFISGITTVDYRVAGGAALTASNVTEGTAAIITADATTITHTVKNATNTGVTNALTVTLDHATAETDVDLATAFVAAGIETLSIVSSGISSPATFAAASENSIATLAGSTGLATVNMSGVSDFKLTTTGAIATLTTINGANMTGRLTVVNASTATGAVTTTGGSNGDTLTGRSGVDSIVGGAGNDTIDGADGNDNIAGDAGNDSITGGTGNDVIAGGDGNDTIDSETGTDSVTAGAGNDTVNFSSAAFTTDLTSADTISGGDGTDTLNFKLGAVDMVTNAANFANVTGFETIQLSEAGAQTLTINDLALSINDGQRLTINVATDQAHVVVASGVLNSSNTINLTTGTAVTSATITYTVGNAKDNLVFGSASDAQVNVTTAGYLTANDTVTGGSGVGDLISYSDDNAVTINTSTANHALTNVTGVEGITINRTDGTATADYTITLTDAFVAANYDAVNGKFTISSAAGDTGDTDVLASAVTTYNLDITGGTAADTITGGGGADTLVGGAGVDTITGGAGNDRIDGGAAANDNLSGGTGNDTFVYDAAPTGGAVDTITDFDLPSDSGSSAASVRDTIELDGLNLLFNAGGANAAVDSIALLSTGTAAVTVDVLILNTQTYADIAAADTALAAAVTATNSDMIFIWADTFNNVHVSYTVDRDTAGGMVDLFILSGVTLTGVAAVVTTANAAIFDTLA